MPTARRPSSEEEPILQDKWTTHLSRQRDEMLGLMRRCLVAAQIGELERCRRFVPGSKIRTATARYVRETYSFVRITFNQRADTPWCEVCGLHKCGKGRTMCHGCRKEKARNEPHPKSVPGQPQPEP